MKIKNCLKVTFKKNFSTEKIYIKKKNYSLSQKKKFSNDTKVSTILYYLNFDSWKNNWNLKIGSSGFASILNLQQPTLFKILNDDSLELNFFQNSTCFLVKIETSLK